LPPTEAALKAEPKELPSSGPDIQVVRQVIERHFPHLWLAVEVGLSTCASLLLADSSNPVALIYVGPPAFGKTTVAGMIAGWKLAYLSDTFTPAAFVSHAANVKQQDLAKVDLLPKIKHKVLITPELAPIFKGKEEDLTQRFSILTRILDGQGFRSDSGTHGGRGYEGDYLFAWIGCTTPFDRKAWKVMAQLGSRLFFLLMESVEEITAEDLVTATKETPYKTRIAECKAAVHEYLDALFDHRGGVRGVQWKSDADPEEVTQWIAQCALLLSRMRTPRAEIDGPIPVTEAPYRAYSVLYNLARGHALVHGRTALTSDDLPPLAQVTASSMPTERAWVFRALVESASGQLTVTEVKGALRVKDAETAIKVMEDVDSLEVMEYVKPGMGTASFLRFQPKWSWCASSEFRAMLAPTDHSGAVCAPPTDQLT
jgi:hypothetical protein